MGKSLASRWRSTVQLPRRAWRIRSVQFRAFPFGKNIRKTWFEAALTCPDHWKLEKSCHVFGKAPWGRSASDFAAKPQWRTAQLVSAASKSLGAMLCYAYFQLVSSYAMLHLCNTLQFNILDFYTSNIFQYLPTSSNKMWKKISLFLCAPLSTLLLLLQNHTLRNSAEMFQLTSPWTAEWYRKTALPGGSSTCTKQVESSYLMTVALQMSFAIIVIILI